LTHHGEADESDVRVRFGHKESDLLLCFWSETNPFLQVALKISSRLGAPIPNAPPTIKLNRLTC